MQGVKYFSDTVTTQSLVMRSRSGTVRMVDATHRWTKVRTIFGEA